MWITCGLLFLLSTVFYFIFFTHNTTWHPKYNKTKQQTHTQHLKVQSKGRESGKDNKNTKVTPLYNHVYPSKNTAKHHGRGPGPTDSRRCTFTCHYLQTCGLLWCFYQLFELSFWRHPFTSLVSKVIKCKIFSNLFWWRNNLIYILDRLRVNFQQISIFGWTIPLSLIMF